MNLRKLLPKKVIKYIGLTFRSLLISTLIVATYSQIPVPIAQTSETSNASWADTNWLYRKPLTVPNSGNTLTNEDVLINIDTSTLISQGKLKNNCNDFRFTDDDNATYLSYWIEDGCNTSSTNIWIRVPSLPNGGKTIYMYYGNANATAGSMSWTGNILMYADTSCPSGWTQASDLNGKFLYGSDTYGNTGGSNTETPGDISCTSSSISTTSISGSSSSGTTGTSTTHTHTNLKATLNAANIIPPYEDMIVCYNNHFLISSGLISLFTTAQATNWTRITSLDNIFARANSTFGSTGGSSTHTHTTTTGYVTDTTSDTFSTVLAPSLNATGGTVTTSGGYTIHTFTTSGTFTLNESISADVLVVAGGGGGAYSSAYADSMGGGGAGGYIYSTGVTFSGTSYTVTVGNGGAANSNGGNSSVNSLIAIGGGHGGHRQLAASTGGSGGGGGNSTNPTGAAGTTNQGNKGGNAGSSVGGGGGGGANSAGTNGTSSTGGNGGGGLSNSISGTSVCYAGGGAGVYSSNKGSATCGGGSNTNGVDNTGGGGSGNHSGGSGIVIIRYPTPLSSNGAIAALNHTHTTNSATVSTSSNIPPYTTMLFEKADTNQYINENNITMVSAIPPLGWSRYTALDNKFVMGGSTSGTTGGSATHTHTVSIATGAPSSTINAYGTGTYFADSTHTHSCSTTTNTASNIPAYYSVIYAQRKVSIVADIGIESTQNNPPSKPADLLTEDLYNPTGLTNTTPKFSGRFSDIDTSDTGNYYQIQVNTKSDFTGTSMWDSNKTAISTPLANNSRSSDISYAGSTLQEGATYYWRMKFWDNNTYSNESPWSDTYQFTMDNTPVAISTNISNMGDIYAGKTLNIQTVYSDANGSTDLDKLYIKITNPSDTSIEYYAASDGFSHTSSTPTNLSGSEFVKSITYDIQMDTPTSDDITVTWNITFGWNWTRSTNIKYGIKAKDTHSATTVYSNTSTSFIYENRLTFTGTLIAKDANNNVITNNTWNSANTEINFSGLKVVYADTTNIYPNNTDFDVAVTNEEEDTWNSSPSSGQEISMKVTNGETTSNGDTYRFTITNIPTGGEDISYVTFSLKTDNTAPVINTLTSSSHPNQTVWYTSKIVDFNWNVSDADSGVYKVWRLIDQTESQTESNIISTGTEDSASNTYQAILANEGIWYVHLLAMDNLGLTTSKTYRIKIDTQNPVISSVTSTTHPNQTKWYTNQTPTVSWTSSDTSSGIKGVWRLIDQISTHTANEILTNGTQAGANDTFTSTTLGQGIWYLHLLAQDNTGKTAYTTYKIQIDPSTPDIVSVEGKNNNVWQNTDSGPIISWTDPKSLSDDTFYITNNGSIPTSVNYKYTTKNNSIDLPNQSEGQTIISVRGINGAGTYSTVRTFTIKYDSTAPTNVTNLKASATETSITLSWTNPTATDFSRVIIVKNASNLPTSLADGSSIYEGNLQTYTDNNVSKGTKYYYAVFALDTIGNQSSGAVIAASTTSSTQPTIPQITDDTKVIKSQDLVGEQQLNVTVDEQSVKTTDSGEIHVYSKQNINIQVPAKTIRNNNTSNIKNVVLVVDNQAYTMNYNATKDNYNTDISAPEVKGAYDSTIQIISENNTSTLAITLSLKVDPYGYIYAKSGNNELRISDAKVTLYKKENGTESLWTPSNGSLNPQNTNSRGEFQFFVEPGEYKIVVEANGYIPTETDWFTVANNTVEKNIEVKKSSYLLYIVIGSVEVIATIFLIFFARKKKKST